MNLDNKFIRKFMQKKKHKLTAFNLANIFTIFSLFAVIFALALKCTGMTVRACRCLRNALI